ncbi:hypothetical protein BG004_007835 [Podila humilis]|nr:hypothetical protein BG004_007835 [Podila humilis]
MVTLGLDPNTPVNVIGYFGQTRDLSMFERVIPSNTSEAMVTLNQQEEAPAASNDCDVAAQTAGLNSEKHLPQDLVPVYSISSQNEEEEDETPTQTDSQLPSLGIQNCRQTGDIHVYIDRPRNTLMLQHAFLYHSQDMLSACQESIETVGKDKAALNKWLYSQEFESHRALLFLFLVSQVVVYTSTELSIDPRITSILLALSTTKRQIIQELDRFMTICWDRIGVTSPDQRKSADQNGHQSGGRSGAAGGGSGSSGGIGTSNIFTPGKCVPVLLFVVERVPITVPWMVGEASQAQTLEVSLVWKKSLLLRL